MESQHDQTGAQSVIFSVDADGRSHVDHASLPTVPAGQPLVEHEVYLDVASSAHGPIVAMRGQTAASGNAYVAQREVDPAIWDLLIREDGEARLRREAETHATATEDSAPAGPVK